VKVEEYKMRFYLVTTGDNVSIRNRNTGELIEFTALSDKKEAKKLITNLSKMTTEEYIKYCIDKGVRFRNDNRELVISKEDEDWFKGAWKYTTEKALKDLGIKQEIIPNDEKEITLDLVKDIKKGLVKKDKPQSFFKEPEPAIEEIKPIKKKLIPKKVKKAEKSPMELLDDELNKLKEQMDKGKLPRIVFLKKKKEILAKKMQLV
jgi:hypothetical protein